MMVLALSVRRLRCFLKTLVLPWEIMNSTASRKKRFRMCLDYMALWLGALISGNFVLLPAREVLHSPQRLASDTVVQAFETAPF